MRQAASRLLLAPTRGYHAKRLPSELHHPTAAAGSATSETTWRWLQNCNCKASSASQPLQPAPRPHQPVTTCWGGCKTVSAKRAVLPNRYGRLGLISRRQLGVASSKTAAAKCACRPRRPVRPQRPAKGGLPISLSQQMRSNAQGIVHQLGPCSRFRVVDWLLGLNRHRVQKPPAPPSIGDPRTLAHKHPQEQGGQGFGVVRAPSLRAQGGHARV